jgi:hypothetical protein
MSSKTLLIIWYMTLLPGVAFAAAVYANIFGML